MSSFGKLHNGTIINQYTISNKLGMQLSAINYGGIITKLMVPDKNNKPTNVVLGYETINEYEEDPFYVGAIIGRCANRISQGKCIIAGKEYQLSKNLEPNHSHHGGSMGFHKVFWNIEKEIHNYGEALKLTYSSKAGDDGYPGNLEVTVKYIITDDNKLIIEYHAETDAPTIANFTQHSYFNLSGIRNSKIYNHYLEVYSNEFLPTHQDGIPTGEIISTSNTALDLSNATKIIDILQSGDKHIETASGLDHCFVFKKDKSNELKQMCQVTCPYSCIRIKVLSTQPGLQCYSSNFLKDNFVKHQAICLEAQGLTNAVNEPAFPSVLISPENPYYATTIYEFGIVY